MTNKMDEILEGLNEGQKGAVQCISGPQLIIAGAGSGKTRVLTSRVAYIIANGVDPSRILALTFTKKAAGEMKERIAMMVGPQAARKVVMGTFHSVFVRFLREYADKLGYPSTFTIYDTSDTTSAIKACIKDLGLDDKDYKPRDVLGRISKAKNNLVLVSSYRKNQNLQIADAHAKKPKIVDIYDLYQQKLKAAGVMDFDDILVNMNILLRDFPEALDGIASRFSHIMVDEYQDTNFAQYLILKKLSQQHRNLSVVGDDSQSIYAFRGAKVENILNFKKDYPECKMFRLEQNYRSTRNIVSAANSLIAHNQDRIPKECFSKGEEGEKIRLIKTYSDKEEAMMIVSGIVSRVRADSAQYSDFAILYRTNAQSRALEEQLRVKNIPYMIYSGNSFFERQEVKDLMAYFKLCVNPNDDESFKRAVNKPARGIGDTSVGALYECARQNSCSLFKAAFREDLAVFGLKDAAAAKIRAFCTLIDSLSSKVKTTDAYALAQKIADDSGLYAFYKADNSIEGQARTANVEELVSSVLSFVEDRRDEASDSVEDSSALLVTLDDFLENVSLLSNADTQTEEDTNNKVALMTVHSAKGLEYPYVYVSGMEDNLFPSSTMVASIRDLEEERRLFYVAMTRAKKVLVLTYSTDRLRNGKHENNPVSRFIREIDAQYIENPPGQEDEESLTGGFGFRFGSGAGGYRNGTSQYGGARPYGQGSRGSQSEKPYGQSGRVTYFHGPSSRPSVPDSQRTAPVQSTSRPAASLRKPDLIDLDFVPVDPRTLKAGQRIEHNRFGAGLIKSISGVFPDQKAVIVFDEYGEKLLLLKYAKLRPEQ